MVTGPVRSDAALRDGLSAWLSAERPDLGSVVQTLARPATGWSNETVLVTSDAARFVVRLPALVPAYPHYDLAAQADVLAVLGAAGVPVPGVHAHETDTRWLGHPFLVMEWSPGSALGETPATDPALTEVAPEVRRGMHEQFVDALAAVHCVDGSPLHGRLRSGLDEELAYWAAYVDWATGGQPPRRLAEALAWCAGSRPTPSPALALLWGDARLGNAMYDGHVLTALLDWELASLGPAEMDLGWYVALGRLTARFAGAEPDGLLSTEHLLDRHAQSTGHAAAYLDWHQVFALVRSTAVNDCLARLAHAHEVRYPGIAGDANPMLDVIWRRIERLDR